MERIAGRISRDMIAGGLMFLLGLGAMVQGAAYRVGTLTRMGPGFFPVSLGVILATCGLSMVLLAKLSRAPVAGREPVVPEWWAWFCILASLVAFSILGTYGGLIPASFAVVFISALGDRKNTIQSALILSGSIVALSVVVFWWGLKLQFSLFSWG